MGSPKVQVATDGRSLKNVYDDTPMMIKKIAHVW